MNFGDGCRLDALNWNVAEVALDGGYEETSCDEIVYFEDSYAGACLSLLQAVALQVKYLHVHGRGFLLQFRCLCLGER